MAAPILLAIPYCTATHNCAMPITSLCRTSGLFLAIALNCAPALAQNPLRTLPESVTSALARARVPLDSVSLLVVEADGQSAPRLSHRADAPMNPASVMKLVTTYAALDLLGPAYTWRTPVWVEGGITPGLQGAPQEGVLKGNLSIAGQGDPKLVLERVWLLLRRVQGLGIRKIEGDIVLDRSAFAVPEADPADFDGEPLRPYNAAPDALLLNFKSVVMTLTPDTAAGVARIQYDPPLWGVQMPATVPLAGAKSGPCGDYRTTLHADFSDPQRLRFSGNYNASCGEKIWAVAYADPKSYNARMIEGLWRSMGGQLTGSVRDGPAPATPATFELSSPALAEVIRDINKFSNNVMAQQLFLTLARATPNNGERLAAPPLPATREVAREVVRQWWQQRISPSDVPTLDNGSGLSRQARVSAQGLARLLQVAYASPFMPELMSSLPIAGLDGTLRRSRATPASAHLKTGSLRDVTALAGYVLSSSGKRLCLVAIVNHANAPAVKPAFDALLDWAISDN